MSLRPQCVQIALDLSGRLPATAQEGMARADENACPAWKYMVHAAIVACARRLRELTVDDVMRELGTIPHCPKNHSLDALGPAMMRGAKLGVLKSTGKVVRGKRPESHGNRHSVWESRVYA